VIDLTDKVCLVTGATGGIGEAITRTLAGQGARVIVHYHHNEGGARALCAEQAAGRLHALHADLGDRSGAFALWRAALAWLGRVDVLINNAAVMPAAALESDEDTWHDAWDATLRVNLVATADLCREAVKHFTARAPSGGIVVNMSSRAAFRGDSPEYMHYAASKAGMIALTRSIARGFGAQGVLAYGVAPGFVAAGMAAPFVAQYGEEAIVRDIPLGQMASAQDVANVVAFLSSGLARHATGSTIDINGASYVR
jgi:NAD(P)-dependent dehydrogenase (short-subunit alcohol dehydrogenase family)